MPAHASSGPLPVLCIISTFNRCSTTIACIKRLISISNSCSHLISLSIKCVDSSSSDGTLEALIELVGSDSVSIVPPSFYWASSMGHAFGMYWRSQYHYLFAFNDDVHLIKSGFLELLLHLVSARPPVLVGCCCSTGPATLTYGSFLPRYSFSLLPLLSRPLSSERPPCTFNGNIVFISSHILKSYGFLSNVYKHKFADLDYGLRLHKSGVPIDCFPRFVGVCNRNTVVNTWLDPSLSLASRLSLLHSPKGIPLREHIYFCLTHSPLLAPFLVLRPYVVIFLSWLRLFVFSKGIC